jgi:hypothetical protein
MKMEQEIQKTHNFIIQNKLHEKFRNDEDYDDWEYGTEPSYGMPINTNK